MTGSGPRVALIVNPSKARAEEAPELVLAACAAAGWTEPLVLETTVAEPGGPQAREALAAGAGLVLAAGGDGTVREVASVLARTEATLGIVPLGTGNLLARNLGLRPGRLGQLIEIALHGQDARMDVAWADVTTEAGTGAYAFLVVAGIGLDADVVGATRHGLKRRLGWLAYGEATMRHLTRRSRSITIAIDAEPGVAHLVQSVIVGNCGLIPGGIRFIPGAVVDDGRLDVAVLAPKTPLGWVPIAGKILFRHRLPLPTLQYHPAREVHVKPETPLAMQLDGDILENVISARVRVDHRALRIRVPDSFRPSPA